MIVGALQRKGLEPWNGTTFSLSRVVFDRDGRVDSLQGYLGSYFDMLCSADYIEYELLDATSRHGASVRLSHLPARNATLRYSASPAACLIDGGGVDSVIAISTLVVYARGGDYWVLCDVRSNRVAEYGDLYHVVPSFIYQPVCGKTDENYSMESSIVHNILREYLEELFSTPEVQRVGRPVAPNYFYDNPNLLFLQELLDAGANSAQLLPTALVFNLLTHRPEICSLLIIHDEEWFKCQSRDATGQRPGFRYLNLNEEFFQNEHAQAKPHLEIVTTLRLDEMKWREVCRPWTMVPPAAPALIFGVREACRVLNRQEPAWSRVYGTVLAR
jgi:hypothetical protein